MPSEQNLKRLCVRLHPADVDYLQEMSRATGIRFNRLVRETLHKMVILMRDNDRKHIDQVNGLSSIGPIELELEINLELDLDLDLDDLTNIKTTETVQ